MQNLFWPQTSSCFTSNITYNFDEVQKFYPRTDYSIVQDSNINNTYNNNNNNNNKNNNNKNNSNNNNNTNNNTASNSSIPNSSFLVLNHTIEYLNVSEIQNSFQLNESILKIVDVETQSEICFCQGDLCNVATQKTNSNWFLFPFIVIFLTNCAWS